MESSVACRCGRRLEWTILNQTDPSFQPFHASIACESCSSSFSVSSSSLSSSTSHTSMRDFSGWRAGGENESGKGKGKGKNVEAGGGGGGEEKANYARLRMIRLKNRFVYNPFQGSEMEVCFYYYHYQNAFSLIVLHLSVGKINFIYFFILN